MDSKTFGLMALQLIEQCSFSGASIDAVVAFRDKAKELAEGVVQLSKES